MNIVKKASKFSKLFRNIFFVFIINFFVMVSLGAIVIYAIIRSFLSGFSNITGTLLFESVDNLLSSSWDYLVSESMLIFPFQLLLFAIFFVIWLILASLRKNLTFTLTKKEIWALVISQWLFLIFILFKSAYLLFLQSNGELQSNAFLEYAAMSLSGIITSFIFWYLIANLLKKEK